MVDSFEQDLHLPRGVQDVDALGVWVVAHAEVPRDGVGELTGNLKFGLLGLYSLFIFNWFVFSCH